MRWRAARMTAIARTPGPGQTLLHEYLASVGDTCWVAHVNAAAHATGQMLTFSDVAPTADLWNLAMVEVMGPSGGAGTGTGVGGGHAGAGISGDIPTLRQWAAIVPGALLLRTRRRQT